MPIVPHCVNGVTDNGEESCDCGGNCDPCVYVSAPCEVHENKVTMHGSYFGGDTVTITLNPGEITRGIDSSGVWYNIDVESDSLSLHFQFNRTSGVPNKIYTVDMLSSEEHNKVRSRIGGIPGYAGHVYLNEIGGKYVLSFCEVYFYQFLGTGTGSSITETITGNITCN